jgi:tetratricopeptide (TPR) repeat protein
MALNRDRIFKAADQYIRSGKVEKAVAEYEKWVASNPKDWNTIRQIGDLYARLGRNKDAIGKYSQIADYYRQDGFNVRAIATHKMILRLDPQNEKAMRNLAELQVMQGLLMEAKAQYQALVELYTKAGHKKHASEVFKKLAEIDPSDLKVRYKFAEFLEREGKVGEAVAEYVGIADEFIKKGLVAEAIQIMEKGLRIDNTSRLLRTKLAQAAILQGHHDKAIQLLEEVREQHPKDVELLSRLGEAYMGAGKNSQAETIFGRLAELEPGNAEHASRLGELAIGQGSYDQALEIISPSVDQLVANREGEKASVHLQKILSRDPHHIKTLLKLVEVQTVVKNDAGIVAAYDKLCEGYSKQGDYEKAVRVAEQLIELEPENSQHRDRVRFLKSKLGGTPAATPELAPDLTHGIAPDITPDVTPDLIDDEMVEPSLDMDHDVAEPQLEESEPVIDVDAAVSTGLEPEPVAEEAPPAAQVADEIEAVASLSDEDDEHIKEKMTEAEVFVRYGLVDKAVEQLKEVLERFRFHTATREKLIEIYRDQGMSSEGAEELMLLSSIFARLGKNEEAEKARTEARSMNPALEEIPADSFAAEDEVDLTLEETPDHYEELTAEASHESPGVSKDPSAGPEEVPVSLDEEDISLAIEDDSSLLSDSPQASELDVGVDVDEAADEHVASGKDVSVPGDEFVVPVVDESSVDAPEVEIDLGGVTGEETDDDVQVEFEDPAAAQAAVEQAGAEDVAAVEEDRTHPPGLSSPVSTAPPSAAPTRDELTEVDEYMALGLYEDARHTLRELLKQRPEDPQVLAKIEEVGFSPAQLMKEVGSPEGQPEAVAPTVEDSLGALVSPPAELSFQPPAPEHVEEDPLASLEGVGPVSDGSEGFGDDYVDLASELSEEVFGTQSAVEETSPTGNPSDALTDPGLDEMFREFKKGVEKQLGSEDYDTRYNLGIAYKEMGLLDEAIAEFQLASKDEGRLLECCSMLGLCFLEKGMPEIAIKWFEKGLSAPGRSEEEQHGLRYDLAIAYEAAGEPDRALELYTDIYRVNARFRDVKDRVQGLQAAKN